MDPDQDMTYEALETADAHRSATESGHKDPVLMMTNVPHLGPGAGLRQFVGDSEDRREGDCEIIFSQSAYQQIVAHLVSDTRKELGGLLLGSEIVSPNGERSTVVVTHALAARHSRGTPVRLSLTQETWTEFERTTDLLAEHGVALNRVGWYHSHPNLSIFLSGYDLDVCSVFTRPTHLALVVDPVQETGGFFVRGRTGFRTHSAQGFWELCDVQADTIVSWRNMRSVGGSAKPSSHEPTSAAQASIITIRPGLRRERTGDPGSSTDPPASNRGGTSATPRLSPQGLATWALVVLVLLVPELFLWARLASFERSHQEFVREMDRKWNTYAGGSQQKAAELAIVSRDLAGLRMNIDSIAERVGAVPPAILTDTQDRMPTGIDAFANDSGRRDDAILARNPGTNKDKAAVGHGR